MTIYRSLEHVDVQGTSVVTIGTFDGIHCGHREILRELLDRANVLQSKSLVVTFDPHPRDVVGKGPVQLLTTVEERLQLFEQCGIQETLLINFTKEFSMMSAKAFYEEYLVKNIHVKEVVIGHDHMFGHQREGSIQVLKQIGAESGFHVTVVPEVSVNGTVVSSSRIRKSLSEGSVEEAAMYLGRPYSISGKVSHGDERGRTIGFPTANIEYDFAKKLIPAHGVYVADVKIGENSYYGMVNIGVRPTFHENGRQLVEVHILDFNDNIYERAITVSFLKRLRAEKKFNSVLDLVQQLNEDKAQSLQFIEEQQITN